MAALVLRTRAIDHDESPHHWDESVTVHTFTPKKGDERWYIKAYFVEDGGPATLSASTKAGETDADSPRG